ncbi:hypothetical protein M758_9G004700 [Ceratodon purpureus]|nr:hypothetical protein M758_9G004700 [Ceratodon purpureus]
MGDNVQHRPALADGTTSLSSHRSTPAYTPPSSASSPFKVLLPCPHHYHQQHHHHHHHRRHPPCHYFSPKIPSCSIYNYDVRSYIPCSRQVNRIFVALDSWMQKGMQQVELELRLLEAFAIYRPSMLVGMHRHFILFGLMDHLERRLNQRFSPDEVLQLLDRFFNMDLLKPGDEELELVSHEEDFSLPPSMFEEIKKKTIA